MTRLLKLYLLAYPVIIILFAIYWGQNFSRFVHFKGDYFIVCVQSLLFFTYLWLMVLNLTAKKLPILLIIFLPVIVSVMAFFIGMLIITTVPVEDTPNLEILLYSFLFAFLVVTFVLLSIRKTLGKTSQ